MDLSAAEIKNNAVSAHDTNADRITSIKITTITLKTVPKGKSEKSMCG